MKWAQSCIFVSEMASSLFMLLALQTYGTSS